VEIAVDMNPAEKSTRSRKSEQNAEKRLDMLLATLKCSGKKPAETGRESNMREAPKQLEQVSDQRIIELEVREHPMARSLCSFRGRS
jgi:hypothetical protein